MTIALAAGSIEAIAEPPATSAIGKVDELPALLADLNADRYEARQRAHRRLAELAKSPEMRGRLAAEYQRLLLDPNTPSEVRTAIESLHASLPLKAPAEVSSEAGEAVDEAPVDFEALVRNLSDDRYNVRTASFARIQWLLGRTEWIAPIMTTLKSRLAAAEGNLQLRRQLESLYEAARGAWLLSEPGKVVLPAISDEQITQWIDDFLHTGNDTRAQHVRRLAEIELLEALARDDVLPRVRAKLETMRGRTDLTAEARSRLAEFMEWLLPAMVAEYWELDPTTNVTHHTGIQHLLLGVPNQPPLAERASLFDRCNERTAHCVTGNALSLGDYPVGVFFPHPTKGLAEFHLVNLPTPRRRMAYEFAVKRDAATRFVEITQR
ncbi:MAG TPA: hypothetical protein VHV77_04350, partial [Pirellulales bacterium]|nr:hypothetical protein [Pirellulales bacterium]